MTAAVDSDSPPGAIGGPSSTEPVVVIVVPRDRFSIFPRCLEAVYSHTRAPFRVTVVAGGVDAATRRYLERLQAEKGNLTLVLEERLLTQGETRNLGLERSPERFVVVLENDTIVHDNWLPPLFGCMRDEGAAVVTPLLWWYRGLHAAGGCIEERESRGAITLRHTINYSQIHRRRIDYPENHCLLIDRQRLAAFTFDDVEPFDVDLGLTLRQRGLSAFLEPASRATYSAPPPFEVRDLPAFKQRWDWATWEASNKRFTQKWGVEYDLAYKRASYRRQRLKLGLASRYPTRATVGISNLVFGLANRLQSFLTRRHLRRSGAEIPPPPDAAD